MGQFEKIVVLTVLFLVAVILVISLSTSQDPLAEIDGAVLPGDELALDGATPAGSAPAPIQGRASRRNGFVAPAPRDLDLSTPTESGDGARSEFEDAGVEPSGSERVALAWPDEADPTAQGEAEAAERESLLLSSTVGSGATAPREAGLPEGAALVTTSGLEDTWDPELKQYTWRSGDSFASVARRLYGTEQQAALLELFNEGRGTIPAGELVLVPVFDRRGEAPARPTSLGSSGGGHVVQDGESLWSIAKARYGRGSDWQRIFDANRDRLRGPDDVRAGMELVIP